MYSLQILEKFPPSFYSKYNNFYSLHKIYTIYIKFLIEEDKLIQLYVVSKPDFCFNLIFLIETLNLLGFRIYNKYILMSMMNLLY